MISNDDLEKMIKKRIIKSAKRTVIGSCLCPGLGTVIGIGIDVAVLLVNTANYKKIKTR